MKDGEKGLIALATRAYDGSCRRGWLYSLAVHG